MSRILKTNDRISRFAEKNLKNKKEFGEDARLAFKRHLNDLKRSEKNDPGFPYIFDPEKAEDIIANHSRGRGRSDVYLRRVPRVYFRFPFRLGS